jgi:hypothetical protein
MWEWGETPPAHESIIKDSGNLVKHPDQRKGGPPYHPTKEILLPEVIGLTL